MRKIFKYILFANNIELLIHKVSTIEVQHLEKQLGIKFFETTSSNTYKIVDEIVKKVYDAYK